jgi:hypothetical protein
MCVVWCGCRWLAADDAESAISSIALTPSEWRRLRNNKTPLRLESYVKATIERPPKPTTITEEEEEEEEEEEDLVESAFFRPAQPLSAVDEVVGESEPLLNSERMSERSGPPPTMSMRRQRIPKSDQNLRGPAGVAVAGDTLFVVDRTAHRVVAYDALLAVQFVFGE